MRIIVCIKQVPGTSDVQVDEATGVLKRDGASTKLNPYDLYALEAAAALCEETGGEFAALSMGPPQAEAALREALYMGAARGFLLSDRRFAGADVLATARALAQAAKAVGPWDLILCGKQTTDGDTAQVGAEMAEFLGLPHANNVLAFALEDGAVALRQDAGMRIVSQRLPLPCLLCVDGGINTPRLPSYRRMRQFAGQQDAVRLLTLDDFDERDEALYGLAGSPTQVERIFPPPPGGKRQTHTGGAPALAGQLAGLLRELKYI